MSGGLPILSGEKDRRAFRLFEPVQGDFSMLCRVVILEDGGVIWDHEIHGEDRNNAIRCGIKLLDGFFDDLLLPPLAVADIMDSGALKPE